MNRNEYERILAIESYLPYSKAKITHISTMRKLIISIRQHIRGSYIQLYLRYMRRCEYYSKKAGLINKLIYKYSAYNLNRYSYKTGLSIYPAEIGEGLTIFHHGSIVINGKVRIGKNCCIHNNVNIGSSGGSDNVPTIGNNVYIGPGAVIFGKISIADNCFIGANAVVCKTVTEPYSILAGVPAKTIKKADHIWWTENCFERE